jgi:hypothetical protein
MVAVDRLPPSAHLKSDRPNVRVGSLADIVRHVRFTLDDAPGFLRMRAAAVLTGL